MGTREDSLGPVLRPTARSIRLPMPRTILALILRDMTTTYGRSPGGYVWLVLEPVLGIALLSAIFSLGFRTPKLGDNFPMFFASGVLPFMLFTALSGTMAQALNQSKALLNYPRVTYIDAILAKLLLLTLTQLLVSFILITGIRVTWDTRTVVDVERLILAYSMIVTTGVGVGVLNCFLMTRYPLWQRGWSIVTRPLFLVSGIIILYESVPAPYDGYLWYNPVLHGVSMSRSAYYLQYDAPWISPIYVFGVSLTCLTFGLIFLNRYHRDNMEL